MYTLKSIIDIHKELVDFVLLKNDDKNKLASIVNECIEQSKYFGLHYGYSPLITRCEKEYVAGIENHLSVFDMKIAYRNLMNLITRLGQIYQANGKISIFSNFEVATNYPNATVYSRWIPGLITNSNIVYASSKIKVRDSDCILLLHAKFYPVAVREIYLLAQNNSEIIYCAAVVDSNCSTYRLYKLDNITLNCRASSFNFLMKSIIEHVFDVLKNQKALQAQQSNKVLNN